MEVYTEELRSLIRIVKVEEYVPHGGRVTVEVLDHDGLCEWIELNSCYRGGLWFEWWKSEYGDPERADDWRAAYKNAPRAYQFWFSEKVIGCGWDIAFTDGAA